MNFKSAVFLTAVIIFSVDGYAGIGKVGGVGKVGSPVVPSNMPKQNQSATDTDSIEDDPPAAAADDKKNRTPLLVITFNQKRLNFDRALSQAIISYDKENPGASYDVVAMIPASTGTGSQTTHLIEVYNDNLNLVVDRMESMGLTSDRIHTSSNVNADVTNEEVYIYGN